MRKILFRGKRLDNGEWVEGSMVVANDRINKGKHYILPSLSDFSCGDNYGRIRIGCFVEVNPNTVGQYTGLTDKNGKKIFEGDTIRHYNHSTDTEKYEVGKIFFDRYSACFKRTSNPSVVYLGTRCTYEIIGNIHDNPELLEVTV